MNVLTIASCHTKEYYQERTWISKRRPVTSKKTDQKLEFLMGKVDVEKRNGVRILFEETPLWFDRYEPRELPF